MGAGAEERNDPGRELLGEEVRPEEVRALLERLHEGDGEAGVTVGVLSEATGRSPAEIGEALLELRRSSTEESEAALRELARELAAWRTMVGEGEAWPLMTPEAMAEADRSANRALVWAGVIVLLCVGLIWWFIVMAR